MLREPGRTETAFRGFADRPEDRAESVNSLRALASSGLKAKADLQRALIWITLRVPAKVDVIDVSDGFSVKVA